MEYGVQEFKDISCMDQVSDGAEYVWNLPRDTEWQTEIIVNLRMLWMLFHQNTWSGQRDYGGKADNNRTLNNYITARMSLSGECLLPRKY